MMHFHKVNNIIDLKILPIQGGIPFKIALGFELTFLD
ncbi:hypothetical protein ES703_73160 [subsurface metagenome]